MPFWGNPGGLLKIALVETSEACAVASLVLGHRVCYDGNVESHVHFYCKKCGKIIDLFGEQAPKLEGEKTVEGNIIQEEQLYYKGICAKCAKKLN
jgi:Fe2+ or Zn2+ uptake regulation protein